MLFNKKSYYNYIRFLETLIYFKFIILFLLSSFSFLFFAYFFNLNILLFTFLGILVGVFLGLLYLNNSRIKTEEMRMKLDIYNKIIEINK